MSNTFTVENRSFTQHVQVLVHPFGSYTNQSNMYDLTHIFQTQLLKSSLTLPNVFSREYAFNISLTIQFDILDLLGLTQDIFTHEGGCDVHKVDLDFQHLWKPYCNMTKQKNGGKIMTTLKQIIVENKRLITRGQSSWQYYS